MQILVTNQPPETDGDVPAPLLELFQQYTLMKSTQWFAPFRHQAEVFRTMDNDRDVFLVAGTAAGKTLAVAVPLFHKLQTGRIRKVLLMYPTIALMEDQREVMEALGQITGLEVGRVQGGMSRSRLIHELTKPVVVATPDAIYWFFRKNVKYNSLLMYALATVDEFVLDEAHLFNGLILRNFEHLWQRIRTLADCLGKSSRLHVLTATPTDALRELSGGVLVQGKSKCHDVEVAFRPSGRMERSDQMVDAVNQALTDGRHKVLVVCNSARATHLIFEKYRIPDAAAIPVEHQLRFGKVTLGELTQWLEQAGVEPELLAKFQERLFREEDVVLDDVPEGTRLILPLEDLVNHTTEVLERQCWRVKHALWMRSRDPGESWEILVNNSPLPCEILAEMRGSLAATHTLEQQQAIVDVWLARTLDKIGQFDRDTIPCRADAFAELTEAFTSAGLSLKLASSLVRRLKFEIKVDPGQLPLRNLSRRAVYLHWLDWLVEADDAEHLREAIRDGIETGNLQVECRHIGLWKGTDVPVIVYSGSMSKQAREGLIRAFSDLKRAVLISTSAVEVGVDFDADTLITEECEGNSFLQRFGRVGRRGGESQTLAFVSGETYSRLSELDVEKLSREDFSRKVVEVFPQRNYAPGSQLLDAGHYLVNEQLGRIGERLNALPALQKVRPIAECLRTSTIQLDYGLRSTMPQIHLRDGVTKDPFYLLRYVDDSDLRPADSPFEIARAKVWFTSLIFQKARFHVMVDLNETLQASQHLFLWSEGQLRVRSEQGIGLRYIAWLVQNVVGLRHQNSWHPDNFVLLHGNVYLWRTDRDVPRPESVRDSEGNSLFIPNQTYLLFWGWTEREETEHLLADAGVLGWEELHYDWDRFALEQPMGLVILEKTTGACFAAYKELIDHVHRKNQG